MRVASRSTVLVDLLTEKREQATLAAYSHALGYRMEIRHSGETAREGWPEALLVREELVEPVADIAAQVIILAIAREKSPREVLDLIRGQIERLTSGFSNADAHVPVYDAPAPSPIEAPDLDGHA